GRPAPFVGRQEGVDERDVLSTGALRSAHTVGDSSGADAAVVSSGADAAVVAAGSPVVAGSLRAMSGASGVFGDGCAVSVSLSVSPAPPASGSGAAVRRAAGASIAPGSAAADPRETALRTDEPPVPWGSPGTGGFF
ncbi:hypothetical protein ACWEGV_39980, partial [Streptomyces sp. NPDC004976]